MKKILKLSVYFFTFVVTSFNYIYAQDDWGDGSPGEPPAPVTPGLGDGAQGTPIDDYAPLLILTGTMIASIIAYKQKELLKK